MAHTSHRTAHDVTRHGVATAIALDRYLPQAMEQAERTLLYLFLCVFWGMVFYIALLNV